MISVTRVQIAVRKSFILKSYNVVNKDDSYNFETLEDMEIFRDATKKLYEDLVDFTIDVELSYIESDEASKS